jgi:outer membrane protein TolC
MNLSWSLWNPWTKSNSFARTKNSLLLQQWQYEDSQITLNNNLSSLQREWDALKLSLRLNTRKSIQAQENLRIAQERYTLGNLTQIELDQARIQSLEAQLALNQIQFNLLRKVQEWKLLYSLPILDKY